MLGKQVNPLFPVMFTRLCLRKREAKHFPSQPERVSFEVADFQHRRCGTTHARRADTKPQLCQPFRLLVGNVTLPVANATGKGCTGPPGLCLQLQNA